MATAAHLLAGAQEGLGDGFQALGLEPWVALGAAVVSHTRCHDHGSIHALNGVGALECGVPGLHHSVETGEGVTHYISS